MSGPHECKAFEPCTYLGRELGWEKLDERSTGIAPHPAVVIHANSSTIYLTMSSFRDRLCPKTLYYLFTKAAHPERVNVGIIQQNAADDLDCLDTYCEMMQNSTGSTHCPHKRNIRINRIDATEARGPTWARALGSQLMEDEEFCMQTDSHMDFVPDWDVHMIDMWALTNNEYAVLSTYVADSATLAENMPGRKGTNGVYEVPHLCMVTFSGSYGMVRNWGTKCMRSMPRPKLTNMVWGAGLSFSKCHAERKAPYDPHTPHIFDGEEFSRALRFWTWGYDIYTPHRVFVVHNYVESQSDPKHSGWGASKISWEQRDKEIVASITRLAMLMEMTSEDAARAAQQKGAAAPPHGWDPAAVLALQQSRFGLGDRRSLTQAIAFSGIDTRQRRMAGNCCGNLQYVPFVEHPWGAAYVPTFNHSSEAFMDVRDPGSIYYDASNQQMRVAWETADALHKLGKRHISRDASFSTFATARAEEIAIKFQAGIPLGPHVIVQKQREKGAAENRDLLARAMEHKGAVNAVCLLVIALIIVARLCVMNRHRFVKAAGQVLTNDKIT